MGDSMRAEAVLLLDAFRPSYMLQEEDAEAQWTMLLAAHASEFSGDEGRYDSLESLAAAGMEVVVNLLRGAPPTDPARAQLRAVVQGVGVPPAARAAAWPALLDARVRRSVGYYDSLELQEQEYQQLQLGLEQQQQQQGLEQQQEQVLEQQQQQERARRSRAKRDGRRRDGWPERAKSSWASAGFSWLQQIEKDLPRTFPGHAGMQGEGRAALRRVLAAYALRNPSVGYCQGMNFIAGVLLLAIPGSEEQAFFCLCALVEDVLRGYYAPDMTATQVDSKQSIH
ncbi:hypothetical protein FOA52_003917 [Chlamydomonas sp. UWO 241]|nr:hypothetical protein FOA52_003917 [Chlamydomonas sp. UWO 241]